MQTLNRYEMRLIIKKIIDDALYNPGNKYKTGIGETIDNQLLRLSNSYFGFNYISEVEDIINELVELKYITKYKLKGAIIEGLYWLNKDDKQQYKKK